MHYIKMPHKLIHTQYKTLNVPDSQNNLSNGGANVMPSLTLLCPNSRTVREYFNSGRRQTFKPEINVFFLGTLFTWFLSFCFLC